MSAVDELLRLYNRDGKLTAEQVVSEATDPSSPLHGAFEWDDSMAAHRFRLDQARDLIRRVEARLTVEEGRTTKVRAIVNIDGIGYVPTVDALEQPDLRDRLFAQMRRDVERFIARYERFEAAAGLVALLREWQDERNAA